MINFTTSNKPNAFHIHHYVNQINIMIKIINNVKTTANFVQQMKLIPMSYINVSKRQNAKLTNFMMTK